MQIMKRDGTRVPFDGNKIASAVNKAGGDGDSVAVAIREMMKAEPVCPATGDDFWSVGNIHDMVLEVLEGQVKEDYGRYRRQRDEARTYRNQGRSALSDYILHSKYAHKGEEWKDVVDRVINMHDKKTGYKISEVNVWDPLRDAILRKEILPSMRSLQFGGAAIEANNARLYNCSFSLCDGARFFSELFFLLLSGCGVGYSVQRSFTKKLRKIDIDESSVTHHIIGDTIEGWADAAYCLISDSMDGNWVEFIYHNVRPKGADLKTTHGKAPGHVPLKRALENVRSVLLSANGRQLTPFECHRICCFLAEGVLSGGIRRSSLICLFDEDDIEMMNCKRGDWYDTYPELSMANNSVHISSARRQSHDGWERILESIKEYGEPGYFRSKMETHGTNPCGEIGLNPIIEGKTGFAFCNLTEVNCATVSSRSELIERVRKATILGTLQAAYTDFPYLSRASEQIARRDALLGVSLTGIMDCTLELTPECMRELTGVAVVTNEEWAKKLDINSAARITTIKPSGTASLLLGCSPGIHPNHAKWYFRRVTANEQEPTFLEFKAANPHMCEKKPNGDWCVTFPCHSNGLTREDMNASDMISAVRSFYRHWIEPGTVREDNGLTHNVSCTITVKDDEWADILRAMVRNNLPQAMSFLSDTGDTVYPFAPFQEVRTVADMAKWIELAKWFKEPDYTEGATDYGAACEGPKCEI